MGAIFVSLIANFYLENSVVPFTDGHFGYCQISLKPAILMRLNYFMKSVKIRHR